MIRHKILMQDLQKKFLFKNINQKSHASFSKKIIVILLTEFINAK